MVMGTVWKTVAVVNAADSSILLLSADILDRSHNGIGADC